MSQQPETRPPDSGSSNRGRGARLMQRLDELAAFSEEPGRLTRRYLSASHIEAAQRVEHWMREAGLATSIDALGTVRGRLEGARPHLPALLLASHIDTVRDAGKYDGALGVLAAIAAAEEIRERGRPLPFALEVYAFGDEEGIRFPTTLMSSLAVSGRLAPNCLDGEDAEGIPVKDALAARGLDPAGIAAIARKAEDIVAYFELHIEQGPQLEAAGIALGAVSGMSGPLRLEVTVNGEAGHAGTVPMGQRRDALSAAAEMVLAVESAAAQDPLVVGTVGRLTVEPGAVNVIPGLVRFTIDLRSPDDARRGEAERAIRSAVAAIAQRRKVEANIAIMHQGPALAFDPQIIEACRTAIRRVGVEPLTLHSGAGHDAISFVGFCPTGMMFVRCLKGISHNPSESITLEDGDIAQRALVAFVDVLAERRVEDAQRKSLRRTGEAKGGK
ncbi:MAG: allantoate amidohydrolase [Hyphomicrobiaceae bacterium]|nr:MAG: allantoate amidohydrolase [Hyphomicrobiaceae bacterium]